MSRVQITVFEHESLKLNSENKFFKKEHLQSLQKFYGEDGVPYYSLINNGVKFNQYVGVIQIDNIIIEVLPKVDKNQDLTKEDNNRKWRSILIDMIQTVNLFKIEAPSYSNLKLKANSILELYFELFIKEVEFILHKGLVKKYRNIQENIYALKGNIKFNKNIQKNLIHKERFYTEHSVYDNHHLLNIILYKTILILKKINTNIELHSRIYNLVLNFPEMLNIKITENTFDQIKLTRKNQHYKTAIEISKLILLNYHPELNTGKNEVLALMFDMNTLWEKFVYVSLKKYIFSNKLIYTISAQNNNMSFYRYRSSLIDRKIRPDIVINKDKDNCIVLDTKWKVINSNKIADADLKQMYVYHEYYNAKKVALIYPDSQDFNEIGDFIKNNQECNIIKLSINSDNINKISEHISRYILEAIGIVVGNI